MHDQIEHQKVLQIVEYEISIVFQITLKLRGWQLLGILVVREPEILISMEIFSTWGEILLQNSEWHCS